ncbi:MAG: tRNA glutamyl-Q(34) synthetase GluQRS [Trueperaceae bacterium]
MDAIGHGRRDDGSDAEGGPGLSGGYRGRFAPSPTGWLHLGNARTALLAWLRARAAGGRFVVRVEDLDGPRTRPEAVDGNLHELRWLGLDWDEGPDVGGPFAPYRQSERDAHYAAALARLRAQGALFPCYLSRKDLAEAASAPHDPHVPLDRHDATENVRSQGAAAPAAYGERERRRSERVAAGKAAAGKTPSLRFAAAPGEIDFDDALAGPQRFDVMRDVGHFVVRRADGQWAYQLAVVVDDDAMGITEVVRGADLLRSTAAQLLLYRALGLTPPTFAHVPLLLDERGERLAKRTGALTLHELRSAGVSPDRVLGLLAHGLGLLPELAPAHADAVLEAYDPRAKVPAGRLGTAELAWLTGST